ncbi:MAG: hypothetical protein HQK49_03520 [Oligoflexia bacterium]|nr:hypothetical protein [Oligoflexia bacterium]
MEENLLIVERVILESLTRRSKDIVELVIDTGLSRVLLEKILDKFCLNGLITKNEYNVFELNNKRASKMLAHYNSTLNKREEIKELLSVFVDSVVHENGNENARDIKNMQQQHQRSEYAFAEMKIKKLWMTPEENFYYQTMLNKIDLFFKEVSLKQQSRSEQAKISEQQVIFFGHSHYDNLIHTFLKNA